MDFVLSGMDLGLTSLLTRDANALEPSDPLINVAFLKALALKHFMAFSILLFWS